MYAPPLSVPEAIRLIAERLALAGHPRTPEDDLAEMGDHPFDAPARMLCNIAVLVGRMPHEIFGGRAPPGVYEQAKAELAAAIAVGDITVTNDLVRRPDIDRLWPAVAEAVDDSAPTSAKKRREIALRDLKASGEIGPSDTAKSVRRRVIAKFGYTEKTVPRGYSEDAIGRDRRRKL